MAVARERGASCEEGRIGQPAHMPPPTDAQRLAERLRPEGTPAMRQRWANLLFLHWAWEPAEIQKTLPAGLTVDLHKGKAWLGLVPFFMERVRPNGCPPVPGVSDFLELNVRTYVYDKLGRPGVWFYSLDCNRWLAVKVARAFFNLPYEHAVMRAVVDRETGEIEYGAKRKGAAEESRFRWKSATGERAALAGPGSLEFFLIERYRLFAEDRDGGLWSGRVHHTPYRIAAAEAPVWDDVMLRLAGFDRGARGPDHSCAAEAVDVEVWPLRRVAEGDAAEDAAGAGEVLGTAAAPA